MDINDPSLRVSSTQKTEAQGSPDSQCFRRGLGYERVSQAANAESHTVFPVSAMLTAFPPGWPL